MEKGKITDLLTKYYDGVSTLEEERSLYEYFSSGAVSEEFFTDRDIFLALPSMSVSHTPDEGFEERLSAKLFDNNKQHIYHKNRSIYYAILSSAAAIILAISVWFFTNSAKEPYDTFDSPELAYAETIKVLHHISSSINSGMQALEPLQKINEAGRTVRLIEEAGSRYARGYSEMEKIEKNISIK